MNPRQAQMAELVDALVSGTSAERRGGSSPLLGTNLHSPSLGPASPRSDRTDIETGQPCTAYERGERLTHGDKTLQGRLAGRARPRIEIAVDTETLGLNPLRDKLCLVQLSSGDGNAHLVQLDRANYDAPRLKALLANREVLKIFHFARFDVAALKHYLGVETGPLYCTKIASKLTRTYTDRHGLKDLVKELLGIELNKQQQSSDWGAHVLERLAEAVRRAGRSLSA